jgi:hypothetical protein
MLELTPITLREARAYVTENHRHHDAPQGGIFALAVSERDAVRGVAIVGRPVARMASDGWTAEVVRCCTDGAQNAPSMLYRACWRAARAMGYRKLVTYTLPEEGGGNWSRRTRPRADTHPTQAKLRWELSNPRE